MSTTTPGYEILSKTWTRMHNLSHLQSIAGWDQAANMPPKGNEARAAAMAEMAALLHRMRTDPQLPEQLARAEQEPLSELQRANLREMKRQWHASNALPESLVQRRQLASSRGNWPARAANTPGAHSARPTTGLASWATSARCWPLPAKKPPCCRRRPVCANTTP